VNRRDPGSLSLSIPQSLYSSSFYSIVLCVLFLSYFLTFYLRNIIFTLFLHFLTFHFFSFYRFKITAKYREPETEGIDENETSFATSSPSSIKYISGHSLIDVQES
jgi:hypothetical protein